MSTTPIQCLCGDVKIELNGGPFAQVYCHCDICQTAHSAAYDPVAMYPAEAVKVVVGKTISWSVARTPRVTCARCGTRLFQEPPNIPVRGVNATLLPKGRFTAMWHHQCQHAVAPIADDLPHYKGYPIAIGGQSDELIGW